MKQTSLKKNSKLTKTTLFVFKSSNQVGSNHNHPTDPTGDPTTITLTMTTSGINFR